jgi:DNA-binding CsgD family transcriptional regulator
MPTLHLVDSARAEPADEAVVARFSLLGHDCVIVPIGTAPMAGRTSLGSLTFGEQRYAVHGIRPDSAAPDPVERLTPRELEIALLIASGYCSKVIGRRLGISAHTVKAHIERVFAKLDVHKRGELIARMAHVLTGAHRVDL